MIRRVSLTAMICAGLVAACTTTPPPEPQGPPAETVIANALADADPYRAEAQLSELLARTDITSLQRADALYHRASLRRLGAENRLGAIDDFNALLALAPDHAMAEKARIELDYTQDDVAALEASLQRMLNLPNWFDTAWTLGRHEEAAARYQRSGISPTEQQVYKLKARGFICGAEGEGEAVYQFGMPRPDLEGLTWCSALDVPEEADLLLADEVAMAPETGS